jgi:hypothetical protein
MPLLHILYVLWSFVELRVALKYWQLLRRLKIVRAQDRKRDGSFWHFVLAAGY